MLEPFALDKSEERQGLARPGREIKMRNAEWKKRKIPNSTFRIPNSVTPLRPGYKLAFPQEQEAQK